MAQINLLCCKFNATAVAIQLDRVIGVVEGGVLTPLPFCAEAFEGLVEALGQVVPQIDLARVLDQRQPESGILIVVTDSSGSLALRVQQVHSIIQIEGETLLETASAARHRHPLFKAEFLHGDQTFSLLDIDRLTNSDKVQAVVPVGEVLLADGTEGESVHTEAESAEEETVPFLLTEICGENYAFDSGDVMELNTPGTIRFMPGAPEWVLGLIDLRGVPILAISTALLLGKQSAVEHETCLIAELSGGIRVALFIDHAVGLERFAPDLVYSMEQPMRGVQQYLVLQENRIVGVINPVNLLEPILTELRAIAPLHQSDSENLTVLSTRQRDDHIQQMLTVRIGTEIFGLTLDRITRIQASVRLTPLPTQTEYFDGMADVGDGVVPVIDLRKQVSSYLPESELSDHPPCLLSVLEGAMMGILVDQVLSIRAYPTDRFEAVNDASKLPISHVVNTDGQLVAVLKIDRFFPAA